MRAGPLCRYFGAYMELLLMSQLMCLLAVKTIDAVKTHVDLSPNWQVKSGAKIAWP